MIAIISDIHANFEALSIVVDDIKKRNIDDIVCLGDIIGYGPDPVKCVDIIKQICRFCLKGNHEAALTMNINVGFNPIARDALIWTKKQIKPATLLSKRETKQRWGYLVSLPEKNSEDDVLYVHGSPRKPIWEYVLKYDVDDPLEETSEKIKNIFEYIKWISFVGHTHEPGIITNDYIFLSPSEFDNEIHLRKDKKYIINVGSVGQPRDGNNKSCYVLFNKGEGTVQYVRLAYDIQKTKKKIFAISELDRRIGTRLEIGR